MGPFFFVKKVSKVTKVEIRKLLAPILERLHNIQCNTDPDSGGGAEAASAPAELMTETDSGSGETVYFIRLYDDGGPTDIALDGSDYTVTTPASVASASELQEVKSKILYSDYQATLVDGAEIDSGWLDMSEVDKVQFSGRSDTAGLTAVIESRSDGSQPELSTPVTYTDGPFYLFNVICRESEMRFRWQNNTGADVNDASLQIKATYGSSDKQSVFPVGVQPSDFSQAALVQAITRGLSPDGEYKAVGVNNAGAILTSDFGTEVARGVYSGYRTNIKYGRNAEIDIGTTPEDIWEGGGVYTGFNATANENLELFSSSANDVGVTRANSVLTAASSDGLTVTDSGASFIVGGVTAGDLFVDSTQAIHGYITNVTATTLTIFSIENGYLKKPVAGDSYSVYSSSGTGAAAVLISGLLDANRESQLDIYRPLNGTTPFTISGNYVRCNRVQVLLAGTTDTNAGVITVRQATTTANVFVQLQAGVGQTLIAMDTVPAGKIMLIKRVRVSITLTSGADGSALIYLQVRPIHGAWRSAQAFDISTGSPLQIPYDTALVVNEGTDLRFRVGSVSDNDTIADAAIEYYLIDK